MFFDFGWEKCTCKCRKIHSKLMSFSFVSFHSRFLVFDFVLFSAFDLLCRQNRLVVLLITIEGERKKRNKFTDCIFRCYYYFFWMKYSNIPWIQNDTWQPKINEINDNKERNRKRGWCVCMCSDNRTNERTNTCGRIENVQRFGIVWISPLT